VLLLAVACAQGVKVTEDDGGDDTVTTGVGGGSTSTGTLPTSSGAGGGSGNCGDGVIGAGETCDGTEFGGQSCPGLGFLFGELTCNEDCNIDASACSSTQCGNGIKEMGEECDGMDFGGDTCASIGMAGGTMVCDSACTITGCKDHYAQDFEMSGLPTGWSTSGSSQWNISTTQPNGGVQCAQSGSISHSQSTSVMVTLTYDVAGSISFFHRESTESSYDYLQFFIDSVMQQEWSGTSNWLQSSYMVSPGVHTFEWRYDKDGSVNSGSDTVWIDDVAAQSGYLP
jgi:hypothetical protein